MSRLYAGLNLAPALAMWTAFEWVAWLSVVAALFGAGALYFVRTRAIA